MKEKKMDKIKNIVEYQRKQTALKKEIEKIKKTIPAYLIGIIFLMLLLFIAAESKVYTYFGSTLNFIKISMLTTLFFCFIYLYLSRKRIKEKEGLSKNIGLQLYHLMKLENEQKIY
jgi:Ca2+/Na+ antiporter